MIVLASICIFLDGLSVVAIYFRNSMPLFVTQLICKFYLISMLWVGWVNIVYVSLDMTSTRSYHSKMTGTMAIVTIIENILILVLPISIYEKGIEVYTYGPAVIVTYIFTIFYIVSALIISVYIISKGNSRRGSAVLITTILWIIGALIQFFNNEFLLVGFAMAAGVMVLYIVMENPDSYLDRNLDCFNSYALSSYLTAKIEENEKFNILEISITNIKNLEDRNIDIITETKKIISAIKMDRDVRLFKSYSTGLLVISKNYEKLNYLCSFANKIISQYDGANESIFMSLVKDAQQFEDFNEIVRFLTYIRDTSKSRLSSTIYVSDDMIEKYREIENVQREIDAALKEDRVEVFYQPICSIEKNIPTSAESLARIRKKDGSLLSPGIFIPVAEKSGQILEIGERVLQKVCEFIRDSEATALGIDTIHVNLSAIQCDDANAATNLNRIVEDCGIDPKYISFEITETAVSSSKDILIENMNILTSKGYKFALDDFGKGESNLMYIVDMPISIIKFDMELSKSFFYNEKARIVVSSVSKMANQLNLPVVAEGIESKEELDSIAEEGVSLIQGYFYSKPLPASEFIEYIKNYKKDEFIIEKTSDETNFQEENSIINIHGNKLLLVEDNEINAEMTQEILEDFGFEVDIANDGTVAVDIISKAKDNEYSLILMDIRMPVMDGYEASRRIRALENKVLANTPIIALTAQNTEEDRKATIEAGMNQFLTKPLDINRFNEIVIIVD